MLAPVLSFFQAVIFSWATCTCLTRPQKLSMRMVRDLALSNINEEMIWWKERAREREKEREGGGGERERMREKERDKEIKRETETERERRRETETEIERQRDIIGCSLLKVTSMTMDISMEINSVRMEKMIADDMTNLNE